MGHSVQPVADRIAWRYEGVLHEYVTADVPHRIVPLQGPWVDVHHEGARSRDPNTYLKDAAILEAALAKAPDNTRYAYYLAQSLRDKAKLKLAFGAATWPHQMVRIMLLEQIYRAITILSGHPYHRE